jgi:hypothetical protein
VSALVILLQRVFIVFVHIAYLIVDGINKNKSIKACIYNSFCIIFEVEKICNIHEKIFLNRLLAKISARLSPNNGISTIVHLQEATVAVSYMKFLRLFVNIRIVCFLN